LETETFSKNDRIRQRREYLQLSRSGRKVQNRYFIAIFASNRQGHPRLGITVSKKVGNAVQRNRMKRLAREYFRRNRSRLEGAWDINLIARKESAGLSSRQIFHSIGQLFDNIGSHSEFS
jgi:ribonuclease P protein component